MIIMMFLHRSNIPKIPEDNSIHSHSDEEVGHGSLRPVKGSSSDSKVRATNGTNESIRSEEQHDNPNKVQLKKLSFKERLINFMYPSIPDEEMTDWEAFHKSHIVPTTKSKF